MAEDLSVVTLRPHDYTVKNIKTFMGMDTQGFNATLYRGSKRIALLIESGNGGEVDFQWFDWKDQVRNGDGISRTPEEKLLYDFCDALPTVYTGGCGEVVRTGDSEDLVVREEPNSYGGRALRYDQDGNMGLEVDMGWFVNSLVSQAEEDKLWKRKCKNATLFMLKSEPGMFRTVKRHYDTKLAEKIREHHGDNLKEIINERYM